MDDDLGRLIWQLGLVAAGRDKTQGTQPPPPAPSPSVVRPPWASDAGTDRFGVYADVAIPGSSAKFRMRLIEPGTFMMGSPYDEEGRFDSEGPQHQVTLTQGFWLTDTPCTQAYEAVMGANPSRFKGADRAVERVSWDDAQEFLQRFNERLPGSAFMLPTEAQWEYAARAGTTTARYGELDVIAWYDGNAGHQTHLVKQKQPNVWGLYDMLGNVLEWTQDGAEQGPLALYGKTPRTDPVATPDEHSARVVRGGAWGSGAQRVRAACRYAIPRGARLVDLGFRLARGRAA